MASTCLIYRSRRAHGSRLPASGHPPGSPWTLTALFGLCLFCVTSGPAGADHPPIQLVLFTHIEDNTPVGVLGSPESRQHYLLIRDRMIAMAHLAHDRGVPWSLQPDWKILRAALLYEDSTLMSTTNGKNFLRHIKEDLAAIVDPHSHENSGYNYTDVAHLLDSLGVGATTVIGGHVWDPDLPQFQEWDRFREPVAGQHYPSALWRGDILMGSGTPGHVDDPVVTGVWRPQDRFHYFTHDPAANIIAIGQHRGTIDDVIELAGLYTDGTVPPEYMLTSTFHITPSRITAAGGIAEIDAAVIAPVLAQREAGLAWPTDFTSLVQVWTEDFGGRGFLREEDNGSSSVPGAPVGAGVSPLFCHPNPARHGITVRYALARNGSVRLSVLDVTGRRVACLVSGPRAAGAHSSSLPCDQLPAGLYLCRLEFLTDDGPVPAAAAASRFTIIR